MRTVRDIIQDLGGNTAVADAHRPPISVKTVNDWVYKNFVPRWRKPELQRIAKEQGKFLPDSDFPPKDQTLRAVG